MPDVTPSYGMPLKFITFLLFIWIPMLMEHNKKNYVLVTFDPQV